MKRPETSPDAYRDDLAYIHDAGFGHVARNAGIVLIDTLRRAGIDRGKVIDLGCGSGILSEAVASAGYDVLGIDFSQAMLDLARKRVPAGEFRQGSFLSADLPPCVAVAAVGECFNYLFDAGNTKHALKKVLRRIYDSLASGGFLIFDVAGPGRVPGPGPRQSFREGPDWTVLVTAEEDERRGLLTRRIISFRKVGDLYRRDEEVHQLRLLPRSEVTAQLRQIGFRVRLLFRYGEWDFPPGYAGFLARKP